MVPLALAVVTRTQKELKANKSPLSCQALAPWIEVDMLGILDHCIAVIFWVPDMALLHITR